MHNHLYDALMAQAKAQPAMPFARTPGKETVSRGRLADGAARFSGRLQHLGLQPGDRVMVQAEKSIAVLQLYLGTLHAGGIFVPLNTAYTASELAYFIKNAAPKLLVCDPSRRAELTGIAARACTGIHVETLGKDSRGTLTDGFGAASTLSAAPVPRGARDIAAILYTSGTTGRPKGAMLSHRALLSNSKTLAAMWCFTPGDVLIHALPIYHTHGLFVATNVALLSGAALHVLPRFDVDTVLQAMPRATAMMGVPTFYTRLLADPRLDQGRTANMRLFISGSAPLRAETHRAWEDRTGHRILERYGMTETNMNTSNPYDGKRRAGTVGPPLPDVELRILAKDGTPVATGATGMIEVRGPNVCSGYWGMPEQTAQVLRPDGWFITGDLGQCDAEGYITIVGRAKDLIISGGFNIYPAEVETEIDAIPGVLESAVIGVPHPDFGEGVVAVIVADGTAPIKKAHIQAALSERLAGFKHPKKVVFLDTLPRNTMGKVQKAELRQTYGDLFTT